jgi:hypothetical protein
MKIGKSAKARRSLQAAMRRIGRTQTRCLVCGFAEVRTDEAFHRGLVLLHECPHCQHRWTRQVAGGLPAAAPARELREVSTAA